MNETERTKAQMNEAINDFVKASQKALLEGVLEIMEGKSEMYRKILQNGYDIFTQSTGDRWYKIYELRNKLWIKILLTDSLQNEIVEKYY